MSKTLDEKAKKIADQAVRHAQRFNITLDYSNESIEKVEQVLELLHEQSKKENITEEQYAEIANIYGCYIGSTLIKNLKRGTWEVEPKNNGLAIEINKEYIFFPAKVYRRLKNGSDENVIALYLSTYNDFTDKPISLKVFK